MARPRSVPEEQVHLAVLSLIEAGGEKAVTFKSVGAAVGMAPSSLAERHGSVLQMIQDARVGAWAWRLAATEAAFSSAPLSRKGAVSVLKALAPPSMAEIAAAPELALHWRHQLQISLAARLGGGPEGLARADILVGYWLSQPQWRQIGHSSMRLKQVLRALL